MKHLFVPYSLALLAKEKGFNEPCLMVYYGENDFGQPCNKLYLHNGLRAKNTELKDNFNVAAPLYQQLVDFFREKHNIEVFCRAYFSSQSKSTYFPSVIKKTSDKYGIKWNDDVFYNKPKTYTYYEALNKALKEAFKLI